MKKYNFINKLLQPLCKAIDKNIAFLLPVPSEKTGDIVMVNVGYKDNRVIKVNVACDSLSAIVKDVIKAIEWGEIQWKN